MLRAMLGLSALWAIAQVAGTVTVSIPLERKAALVDHDAASKTFYVGKVLVGNMEHPQELQVAFETASGSLVLDSTHCRSPACLKHRQYMPSRSAAQLNRAGGVVRTGEQAALSVDYNEESHASGVVRGDMMRDQICLGSDPAGRLCTRVGFLAAANMTDDPFSELPVDGIVGLSLEGLSISNAFNFLHCISHSGATLGSHGIAPGLVPSFGLFLPKHGFGEITFGGYNSRRLASQVSWVPVEEPTKGFWQVAVKAVYIGRDALDFCRDGCRAIIDSSSSHLTVPSEALPIMQQKLAVTAVKGWLSERPLCEQAVGLPLTFVLADGNLTLDAKEYSALEGHSCIPQLHPWDVEERQSVGTRREGDRVVAAGVPLQTIVLGEPLLRKYYTIFEASAAPRVGFGVAANEVSESDEIILMQSPIRKEL